MGDLKLEGDSLDTLGTIAVQSGLLQEAADLFSASIEAYLDADDTQLAGWACVDDAALAEQQRNVERCRAQGELAATIGTDLGDDGLVAWASLPLSWAYLESGDLGVAKSLLGRAIPLFHQLGNGAAEQSARERLRNLSNV